MLARNLRFHGHGSLRFLYKNADAYRSRYMTVKLVKNPRRNASRFSVVVSKKVHKSAVGRNRIRRRLYELLRAEYPHIVGVYDIAVIVTNGETLGAEYESLRDTLHTLLEQAGVFVDPTH